MTELEYYELLSKLTHAAVDQGNFTAETTLEELAEHIASRLAPDGPRISELMHNLMGALQND